MIYIYIIYKAFICLKLYIQLEVIDSYSLFSIGSKNPWAYKVAYANYGSVEYSSHIDYSTFQMTQKLSTVIKTS